MITDHAAELRISISIVVYCGDNTLLAATIGSLAAAVRRLRETRGESIRVDLSIIDNGATVQPVPALDQLASAESIAVFDERSVLAMDSNAGYGSAHNHAVSRARSDFHLVLNPDVELAGDALCAAVAYLVDHPDVVGVVPCGSDRLGKPLYLAKRYPSVLILLLRGLAPELGRRALRRHMNRYEMRDVVEAGRDQPVELASGCFMFLRTGALQAIGGFSQAYFLYFEDFDLSIRLRKFGPLVYVPGVRITHHGGQAARKGRAHIGKFLQSARVFFGAHGWRIF